MTSLYELMNKCKNSSFNTKEKTETSKLTVNQNTEETKIQTPILMLDPLPQKQWQRTPQLQNNNNNKFNALLKISKQQEGLFTKPPTLKQQTLSSLKRQRSVQHEKLINSHSVKAEPKVKPSTPNKGSQEEEENDPIKGKSQQVFKPFLRITDVQSAEQIRSEQTLNIAFYEVKRIIEEKGIEYLKIVDQLKSIRQDLHVQHINNQFTLEVLRYSLHYALQNSDLIQFGKCLGQIKQVCQDMKIRVEPIYVSLEMIFMIVNSLFIQYQSLIETMEPRYLKTAEVQKAMRLFQLLQTKNYSRVHREYMTEGSNINAKINKKHSGSDLVQLLLVEFRHKLNKNQTKVLCQSNKWVGKVEKFLKPVLYEAKEHDIQKYLQE